MVVKGHFLIGSTVLEFYPNWVKYRKVVPQVLEIGKLLSVVVSSFYGWLCLAAEKFKSASGSTRACFSLEF